MNKELKIVPPEGFVVDTENSTFEKIVFKPIDPKPRSWEEYCKQQQTNNKLGYYFNHENCRIQETSWAGCCTPNAWKNALPSEEYVKAFLAMMQLASLRQAWIGDWEPDWTDRSMVKFVIRCKEDIVVTDLWVSISHPLSFPTLEMAEEFLGCFRNLIEIAKSLI